MPLGALLQLTTVFDGKPINVFAQHIVAKNGFMIDAHVVTAKAYSK